VVEVTDIRFYVLNLLRRPDRRERITRMLPPGLPVIFTSEWTGLFDSQQVNHHVLKAAGIELHPWQIESDDEDWCRPLKIGEIGCTLHHLASWHHAWSTGVEPYVVVFEDDAVIPPDFLDHLLAGLCPLEESGYEFDMLYLGRYYEPAEDTPAAPGFVRPGLSYGAHGYLLTRSALKAFIDAGLEKAIVPIDEFLPCMYMDHPRPDLTARFPRRLRALAFDPMIVNDPPRGDSDQYWTPLVDW
jgi:collagen beta-1,O-galactosyltransferase